MCYSGFVSMASPELPNLEAAQGPASEEEHAELASVLASPLFRRSPKVSRLLSYLCEKHFRGETSHITEYGIAVDVLGRDAGFNPQVDAVVRVDAHHLRKRLKEYYATEGREHKLAILIPAGCYAPEFVIRPEPGAAGKAQEAMPASAEPLQVAGNSWPGPLRTGRPWFLGMLALSALAVTLYAVRTSWRPMTRTPGSAGPLPVSLEADQGIRILAGVRTGDYIDRAGRTWLNDRYFQGGTTFHRPGREILRTPDPEIFQSGREGQFVYEIPLDPGVYELRLYFAETGVASEGLRGVNLAINGIPHSTLDVASDAGAVNTAAAKIYTDVSPARDGLLHLTFSGSDPSFVNAFEIVRGIPGKMRPLRFSSRDSVFRDRLGRIWLPEMGVSGGRRSARIAPISGTDDPELYVTQRFGHFTYSISVVEGRRYTVTLHFAETWFGLPNSAGGVGKRIFDVYCNGTTLLNNFDILQDTVGIPNRALVKVLRGIPASPQGKLEISFVPVANYALLSAIEVEQE